MAQRQQQINKADSPKKQPQDHSQPGNFSNQTPNSNQPQRLETPERDWGNSQKFEGARDTSKGAGEFLDNLDDVLGQDTGAPGKQGEDPAPYEDVKDKFKDYDKAESQPTSPQENSGDLQKRETEPPAAAAPASIPYSPQGSKEGKKGGKFTGKGKGLFRGASKRGLGVAAGLGAVTLLLGSLIGGIGVFRPNLFSGLLDDFYGKAARHVVEKRMRAYMFGWIRADIMETAKACKNGSANIKCINKAAKDAPKGLMGTFFVAMRQAKVNEALLANRIVFTYTEGGGRGQPGVWKIVTKDGISTVPDTAEGIGNYRVQKFMNGKAFDREMKNIVSQHFNGSMKRKIIKATRRNMGNKMCIFFCNRQDNDKLNRTTKFAARKEKYYNMMAKAAGDVIVGGNARLTVLLYCILGECKTEQIRDRLREMNTTEARLLLEDNRALDAMSEDGARLRNQSRKTGVFKLLIRRVLTKMLGEVAGKAVVQAGEKALGPIGIAVLLITAAALQADVEDLIYDFSGEHKLQIMWDGAKKPVAAGAYNIVNTGADEMFGAGHGKQDYDLAALAATDDRLNGIEKATAYPYLFGSLTTAQTVRPGVGKCEGYPDALEKDVKTGAQIFCPNDRLGTEPPLMRAFDMAKKLWPIPATIMEVLGHIHYSTSGWVATVIKEYIIDNVTDFITWVLFSNPASQALLGGLGKATIWALEHLLGPYYEKLKELGEEGLGQFLNFFLPVIQDQDQLRGPVLATQAMIGDDWVHTRYLAGMKNEDGSIDGLGAPPMSRKNANILYSEIEAEEREDMKYASVGERYFSLDNPKSLVAQLLMSGPAASATNSQGFAAMASNPFDSLLTTTASLLSGRVSAAPTIQRVGATGTIFYAYPSTSKFYTADLLEVDGDECDATIKEGFKETDKYDAIGDPIFEISDAAKQCMIDKAAVGVGTVESLGNEGEL